MWFPETWMYVRFWWWCRTAACYSNTDRRSINPSSQNVSDSSEWTAVSSGRVTHAQEQRTALQLVVFRAIYTECDLQGCASDSSNELLTTTNPGELLPAMCGPVGYCSRRIFGSSNPSTCWRQLSSSFSFMVTVKVCWGVMIHRERNGIMIINIRILTGRWSGQSRRDWPNWKLHKILKLVISANIDYDHLTNTTHMLRGTNWVSW